MALYSVRRTPYTWTPRTPNLGNKAGISPPVPSIHAPSLHSHAGKIFANWKYTGVSRSWRRVNLTPTSLVGTKEHSDPLCQIFMTNAATPSDLHEEWIAIEPPPRHVRTPQTCQVSIGEYHFSPSPPSSTVLSGLECGV